MILGAVSFSPEGISSSVTENLKKASASEGLIYYDVKGTGLNGGLFLSTALPYLPSDFHFTDREAGLLVMMSGVLFNRGELARHAAIDAEVPDPVLVSRLFQLDGPDFAKRLNGDFAIYIELPARKEAYLFRDHIGIRPLAYYFENGKLFFSSDKTGLSRFQSGGRNIDSEYLAGFFKYTDRRKAPFSSVKTLSPGHNLHLHDDKIEISAYWKPSSIHTDRSLTHEQLLADMEHILRDAVRVRCDSRFTAGGHVSGGLDSSVVVALASVEYPQQNSFYGFSWSPDEKLMSNMEDDERYLVRCFCKEKNIIPLFSDLTSDSLREKIASVLYNRMYFFEDRVLEQAGDAGVNLIFSGWGGDDFVSTGGRGVEIDLLRHFKLRTFFRRNQVRPFRKFVKYFLKYVAYPLLGMRNHATVRFFNNEVRYLKAPFKISDKKAVRDFYYHSSRRQLHLRLLQSYHIQERCESWAVNGYRKGVEYRYPLLDKRIIEYMLRVPSELLCRTDHFRPLLREISEGLIPEKIRLNWSKVDKAYQSYMRKLFREMSGSLMTEVSLWKDDYDLRFIDFDLLTGDIQKYMERTLEIDEDVFFRALVTIGSVHKFTAAYRQEF